MLVGRRSLVRASLALALAAVGASCGGSTPRVKEKVSPVPTTRESTVTTEKPEPKVDPFQATSGPGDSPVPFVRDERSSRLDLPSPHGKGREAWRAPLGGSRREPCRGVCAPAQATFVIAAGNRVAVTGGEEWVLFDTSGHRVDGGKLEGPMRLDRAGGTMVPDETRSADTPADAKIASHGGLVATVNPGSVNVGERSVEGKFDAYDVAIDENDVAWVVVRQADILMVWTVPVAAQGSIGRHKVSAGGRKGLGPPLIGKRLRVIPVDNGFVALGPDGKRIWERRGVPSGGASITSDDHVLIADNGSIVSIDPRGKATELWKTKDIVFVSPPILNAAGLLLVASAEALHALSFS